MTALLSSDPRAAQSIEGRLGYERDEGPIRGELCGPEHLEELARALALSDSARTDHTRAVRPRFRWRPWVRWPLLARLRSNARFLVNARRVMRAAASAGEPLSLDADWLLDNFHVIEQVLREVKRDLPRGYHEELPLSGIRRLARWPRVYALALALTSTTDSSLEEAQILNFVRAFQTVTPLTIGELWAIPTMLRLVLLENLRRLSAEMLATRADGKAAEAWAERARTTGTWPPLPSTARDAFFIAARRALGDHGPALGAPPDWLTPHGHRLTEALRREHQRQAANQVTIGNCITSLRLLNYLDWSRFVEQVSLLEAELRADPAGIHPRQDFATRDRYRRVVERLARGSGRPEWEVARRVVERARQASLPRERHVGWHLIDRGQESLARSLGFAPRLGDRWRAFLLDHPDGAFFSLLALLTAFAVGLPTWIAGLNSWPAVIGASVLALIPASELALGLINALFCRLLPPSVLPKLDFREGVPVDCPTFVVVPCMLSSAEGVARLVERLELHFLANSGPRLSFALLTDFADADAETMADDARLLEAARAGIAELNRRHALDGQERFFLFHRRRQWNPAEERWMGWERKRGKLHEFLRFARGDRHTSFVEPAAPPPALEGVRFVLTLDADTVLPRDAAARMICALGHPLQGAIPSADGRRVTEGYAILQPRVSFLYRTGLRSRFARVYAVTPGIDPYGRAVSDVYQDLFGRGTFTGKGLIDVNAFLATTGAAFPDNHILSHDLIESTLARCALASDIEIFDEFPARYHAFCRREHRWIRGDWQLLPWLGRSVPTASGQRLPNVLPLLERWKILDNMRRSLVAPALVAVLLLSLGGWLGWAVPWLALVAAVLSLPLWLALVDAARGVFDGVSPSNLARRFMSALPRPLCQTALDATFLAHRALLALDAIFRVLWRLGVSRRGLLEWETAAATEQRMGTELGEFVRHLLAAPLLAVAAAAGLAFSSPGGLAVAGPLLVAWLVSPWIAYRISLPLARRDPALTPGQRTSLAILARKTWGFFERFVGDEDNGLPPDNFQAEPGGKIAHRTSPTNIGFYLLSTLTAHDLGYITRAEVVSRARSALATMDKLERFRGHFLNWYDTRSLTTLAPTYVSTVDSGNLLASLWVLARGLREKAGQPLDRAAVRSGLLDTLEVVVRELSDPLPGPASAHVRTSLAERIDELRALLDQGTDEEHNVPLERFAIAAAELADAVTEARFGTDSPAGRWCRRLAEQARRHASEAARDQQGAGVGADELASLADKADLLAQAMDFRFLYDPGRHLFSVGYNVSLGRLDGAHYDLLASESCLTSFLAIARGDVPRAHWFQLGRPYTRVAGLSGLLSWGGTMFEYLMPRLLLPIAPGTLLDSAGRAAVARQREYGREKGVPWGVSESGFYYLDAARDYQYQAFGVPGLGLKRGLDDHLVVAPYAAILAVTVDPVAAIGNLQRLRQWSAEGEFGYYEAVDYTPEHLPPGRDCQVVQSYMAHHQGMALAALGNRLTGDALPRRLRAHPMVRATELLLDERVPLDAPLVEATDGPAPGAAAEEFAYPVARRLTNPDTARPRVHLLSNGRYTVMLTNAGAGFSVWNGLDVTRWRADGTRDDWGPFLYVRDLADGQYWSVGHQPVRRPAQRYEVVYALDKAEIRRVDGDVETHLEVTVAPDSDIEVRRVTLYNHGDHPRRLEVTSYAELVLAPHAADVAHRAFGQLFLETEWLEGVGGLLCRRRPRDGGDKEPWALHGIATDGQRWGPVSCETDRRRFIGRRRSPRAPAALDPAVRALSGVVGPVLEPIFSLRCAVHLPPGASAVVSFSTGIAGNRADALAALDRHHTPHAINHVFELAWAHGRVEMRHPGITVEESYLYQRIAGHILFPSPALRAGPAVIADNRLGQPALWRLGISGDLPIVVARIANAKELSLVDQLLEAHSLWARKGLRVDLVFLSEDPNGYLDEMNRRIVERIRASEAHDRLDQPGGIFPRRARHLMPEEQNLLLASARIVLAGDRGSLADQIDVVEPTRRSVPSQPTLPSRSAPPVPATRPRDPRPTLRFFSGIGGFSPDGREYVLPNAKVPPPLPWINVVANPQCGFLASDASAGCTWVGNSQTNRLTPWSNDPVGDPPGEVLYLRDEGSGAFWSLTPAPGPAPEWIETRHGAGYTTYRGECGTLAYELTLFVPRNDPVKIWMLALRERGRVARQYSATFLAEWVLGVDRERTAAHIVTEIDGLSGPLLARNPFNLDFPDAVAFCDASEPVRSWTADRAEFIGRNRDLGEPAVLEAKELSNRAGAALDPCAALRVPFSVPAGQERTVVFVLGQAADRESARQLARYRDPEKAKAALAEVGEHWDRLLGTIEVRTPDGALDLLLNRWLLYQVTACRLWGRSAFYQSGGAYGFRDQLQDVMALMHAAPEEARRHILRAAAHQFVEGDVQHWWHPPVGRGVRTRFSDDFLWLPYVVCHYVQTTGDRAILDEPIPFLRAAPLAPEQAETYGEPSVTEEHASLYEHCVRSLDNGGKRGPHGLPLMGGGDWNDGMNRVGIGGRGESVWVAWFQISCLRPFADIASARDDHERAADFRDHADELARAIEENAWDGQWYRRAYFDDGTPLGSGANSECQIDSIAQTWAILSGAGNPERARTALEHVLARLVKREDRLILLLDPPFDHGASDPGYIKGYLPGIRENGGQYTHAAIWLVQAVARLGQGTLAHDLLSMVNPVARGHSADAARRYQVEPYVVAADIYGREPHVGRGGWTWYTGSAAWLYRVGLETILGFERRGDRLRIDPCIPKSWRDFEIRYRHGSARYTIIVTNPQGAERGVRRVSLDGHDLPERTIPLRDDGGEHEVRVEIGA